MSSFPKFSHEAENKHTAPKVGHKVPRPVFIAPNEIEE